jgi:hypothetical protein
VEVEVALAKAQGKVSALLVCLSTKRQPFASGHVLLWAVGPALVGYCVAADEVTSTGIVTPDKLF